jgi:hypothetical protein
VQYTSRKSSYRLSENIYEARFAKSARETQLLFLIVTLLQTWKLNATKINSSKRLAVYKFFTYLTTGSPPNTEYGTFADSGQQCYCSPIHSSHLYSGWISCIAKKITSRAVRNCHHWSFGGFSIFNFKYTVFSLPVTS